MMQTPVDEKGGAVCYQWDLFLNGILQESFGVPEEAIAAADKLVMRHFECRPKVELRSVYRTPEEAFQAVLRPKR